MRRVAVVINASAGSLIGKERAAEEVADHLSDAGLDAVIEAEGPPLPERIRAAHAKGAEMLVVGGGDGTIACAAQVLGGTGAVLGILPLGTMNLLAKDLRIPLNVPEAVEALAHGVEREIDVGEVNGRVFLCNSVLGMPSHLAEQREKNRGAIGLTQLWRMAVAGTRSLNRYPPLTVALDVGGGPRRIRTRALAIVDNDYDEGVGQLFTRSRLDGGELVVYVTKGLGLWRVLRLGVGMAMGSWRTAPGLERHAVKRLVIHARRRSLRVMNDGEVMMLEPPLRYRVRPRALKVIVPRAAEDKAEATAGDQVVDAA